MIAGLPSGRANAPVDKPRLGKVLLDAELLVVNVVVCATT
jgi:hypothetical protein